MTSPLIPPTVSYICQFPIFFYLLSAAVFSQGKRDSVTPRPPPFCLSLQVLHKPPAMSRVPEHSLVHLLPGPVVHFPPPPMKDMAIHLLL